MSDDMFGDAGSEVIVEWAVRNSWRGTAVRKIAESKIVTASALGCDLYPERSKSIIKGYKQFQNRGKVSRNESTKPEAMNIALADVGSGRSRGNRLRCRKRRRI
jgi:hypothetical protein